MKKIEMFKCEVTGRQFSTEAEAEISESKHREINATFAFYTNPEDQNNLDSCNFSNGEYAFQRDKVFYEKLIDGIIKMVEKYEPEIFKNYERGGGLTRDRVTGYSLLGRFLDDSGSPLYKWWHIQANICPTCFREWGQYFYTNSCSHNT